MKYVKYEKLDGKVALITLNRPERLNALGAVSTAELHETLKHFDNDPGAAAAIVTGTGKAFCVGRDLKEGTWLRNELNGEELRNLAGTANVRKPLVAAVNGYALGAGMMLAMGCDIHIAAESAVFGLPELKRGIVMPGCFMTANLIPYAFIMELSLTGESISARRAYEMGLVNRVVADGELLSQARSMAQQIAAYPTEAVIATKEIMRKCVEASAEIWERAAELRTKSLRTPEAEESHRAFTEK